MSGSAEFATMEGQLSLRLVGDGKGHIELRGELADQTGIGNARKQQGKSLLEDAIVTNLIGVVKRVDLAS